jgi:hypothetical protein
MTLSEICEFHIDSITKKFNTGLNQFKSHRSQVTANFWAIFSKNSHFTGRAFPCPKGDFLKFDNGHGSLVIDNAT